MRTRKLLSVGLVSALGVAGLSAVMISGCSEDAKPADGGMDQAVADNNVPPPDGAMDSSMMEAGPPRARLTMVHGSLALPAVRVCFAILGDAGESITPFPPLPDTLAPAQKAAGLPYPGLYPGTGGPLPDTGTNLENITIVPYIVVASKVAQFSREDGGTPRGCDEILKPGDAGAGLVANQDYFKLPPIQAGTFQAGKSFILAAIGCPAGQGNNVAGKTKCGLAYDDTSNIAAKIFEVSKTVPAMQAGAQFLHLSPVVGAAAPGGVKAVVTEGDAAINPNAVNYLDNPAPAMPVQVNLTQTGAIALYTFASDGGASPLPQPVALPLALINQLSGNSMFAYVAGNSYTFVAVGDPNQPQFINPLDGGALAADAGGRFNGYTFHLLGFPNEFTPPKL